MASQGIPGAVVFPAADRNKPFILDCLKEYISHRSRPQTLLEVGAGTGQHMAHFAPHFPLVTYYPTEAQPSLLNSINAYRSHINQPNVKEAAFLDVTKDPLGWLEGSLTPESFDYILSINMIHISPFNCTEGLFSGAKHLLKCGGYLFLYGPFAVSGVIKPESNVDFDRSLRQQNKAWGLRDMVKDLVPLANKHGMRLANTHELPANNKFLAWMKL